LDEYSPNFLSEQKAEVQAHAEELAQKLRVGLQGRNIEVAFAEFDDDNSGMLNLEEFRIGLEKMGLRLTGKEVRDVMQTLDHDRSGEIRVADFVRLLSGDASDARHDSKKGVNEEWELALAQCSKDKPSGAVDGEMSKAKEFAHTRYAMPYAMPLSPRAAPAAVSSPAHYYRSSFLEVTPLSKDDLR
jgi:hypothetical protein